MKKSFSRLEWMNSIAILLTAFAVLFEAFLLFITIIQSQSLRDRPALMIMGEPQIVVDCEDSDYLILKYNIKVTNHGSGNAYKIVYADQNQIPPLHFNIKTKEDIFSSYDLANKIFLPQGIHDSNIIIGTGSFDEFVFYEKFSRYSIGRKKLPGLINHKKYIAFFYESEEHNKNATILGVSLKLDLGKCNYTLKIEDKVIVNDPRR